MPSEHYFSSSPSARSDRREIDVAAGQPAGSKPLRIVTDAGTFSHGKLDLGTEVLLRGAPPPPTHGTFLDLGTGNGVLALTLARRSPAATVIAVDVNERARELAVLNAAGNDLSRVTVGDPADVDPRLRFDLIWSNPPVRIGKQALHALLATWLGRLAEGGRAVLVVHKNLGADSLQRWLTSAGWSAERLSSSKGYRLLEVTRTPGEA